MPYVVGIVLSLSVALFARRAGFDRDRAFYPAVLIVIASYYVLFAAMSESVQTLLLESMMMIGFSIAAVVGFKSSAWIVVGGLRMKEHACNFVKRLKSLRGLTPGQSSLKDSD
jgi:hypothetical protein